MIHLHFLFIIFLVLTIQSLYCDGQLAVIYVLLSFFTTVFYMFFICMYSPLSSLGYLDYK